MSKEELKQLSALELENYLGIEKDFTKTRDYLIKDKKHADVLNNRWNIIANAFQDWTGVTYPEEISFRANPNNINNSISQKNVSENQTKTFHELFFTEAGKGIDVEIVRLTRDEFSPSKYKKYLEAMSKFYRYSPRNIQLILKQNPDATHIASSEKWKTEFQRTVKEGEDPLWLIAPVSVKEYSGGLVEQDVFSYKFIPMFDISQTEGKELEKLVYELNGTYEDYGKLFKAAKEVSETNGVFLSFGEDTGKTHGYFVPFQNKIIIKKGMSDQQTLKTIFHEMVHAKLHVEDPFNSVGTASNTAIELLAESVTFVVANHYGLDTSDYRFGILEDVLRNWNNYEVTMLDLHELIEGVQKEANHLISRLDQTLEKIQKKELKKEPLQEKIERFKQETNEKIQEVKEKEMASERAKKSRMSDKEIS